MKIPLYTKFSSEEAHYLYDAVTNNFLQVDPIVYGCIDAVLGFENKDSEAAWQGLPCTRSELERARGEILKVEHEGMLVSEPVKQLGMAFSPVEVRNTLQRNCQQLILEITRSCNMRCRYCIYSGLHDDYRCHADQHLSESLAGKALAFYVQHSLDQPDLSISFYGGEPLLRLEHIKDIVSQVNYLVKGRTVDFNITTNGTLLSGDAIDFLVKHDFQVMVSLDGPAEMHDRYRVLRDGSSTYHLVVDNLERLHRNHPDYFKKKISLSVVLGPPVDYRELEKFFSRPLYADMVMNISGVDDPSGLFKQKFFKGVNPRSAGYDWIRKRYQEMLLEGRKPSGFLRAMFEKNLLKIHHREIRDQLPEIMRPSGICLPGERRLYVDVYGVLHPCERVNSTMPLGTVADGFDAFRIAHYVKTFRTVSQEECCSCWALGWCSICFHNASGNELTAANKLADCEIIKSSLKEAFSLYCSIAEHNPAALSFLDSMALS